MRDHPHNDRCPARVGLLAFAQRRLPGLDPEPAELRRCWVADLPWSEDGLAVWERDGGELMVELRPEARLGEPQR